MTNGFLPLLFIFLTAFYSCMNSPQPTPDAWETYADYPVYEGDDLGLNYSPEVSTFKLWAPTASKVKLSFFEKDLEGEPKEIHYMEYRDKGLWEKNVKADLKGIYYTFSILHDDTWLAEVPDPYARAVGINGVRAQVVDLKETNPVGWDADKKPTLAAPTDVIIYELHVRDLSLHPASGISNRGKFLALTEKGTKNKDGLSTGIDYLQELGITHLHLLPSYDYMSVDESKLDRPQFNWGYDPHNYNVPEGSYATDPANGALRIKEFKQMVKALHEAGIRVVMDVVYNHTGLTETSIFNQLVPGYYYRHNTDGSFANASACGNETSSDLPMTRKMILESVKYWVNEYHIDGFRFDLMGIHDIETMNIISEELHKIDPTIFIYGEGWTAGDSPLPIERRALKAHVPQLKNIAAFSDDLRDGLKGSVFEHKERGFVSGKIGNEESIKFGIVAATNHPQVDYKAVNYSNEPWAPQPHQCINYVSCHDNHTLYDRLKISNPEATETEIEKMHRLAQTIVLTSQGVSFLHAGTEFLRTKGGEENSYKSSDAINQLDWNRRTEKKDVVNYYKNLIDIRKKHPAFRMGTTAQIAEHLKFHNTGDQLIAYTIDGAAVGDSWEKIFVVFNGKNAVQKVKFPKGLWTPVINGARAKEKGIGPPVGGSFGIPALRPAVFYQ